MNDEQGRVGFFRGLLAVLRGVVHAIGVVIGWFGRVVARLTRRSRPESTDETETESE